MSEESKKQALEDLENNIPYDYCRSCDSSDGLYHEYIDDDSWQYKIKMLLEEKDKEIEFHKNNERIAIDCQNKLSEKIEQLYNTIENLKQENAVLKTLIVNNDNYTYGIR